MIGVTEITQTRERKKDPSKGKRWANTVSRGSRTSGKERERGHATQRKENLKN